MWKSIYAVAFQLLPILLFKIMIMVLIVVRVKQYSVFCGTFCSFPYCKMIDVSVLDLIGSKQYCMQDCVVCVSKISEQQIVT